jgi:hypothetical protein
MLSFYSSHGIVKCPVCGLVFFDDIALPEELYTESYFTGGEYLDYVADKATIQRNFRRHLPALRRLAPHGDLFDIVFTIRQDSPDTGLFARWTSGSSTGCSMHCQGYPFPRTPPTTG